MKTFEGTFNSSALDAAIVVLFGTDGRDKMKKAYDIINSDMTAAYNAGRSEADKLDSDKIEQLRLQEFNRGYAHGYGASAYDNSTVALCETDNVWERDPTVDHELIQAVSWFDGEPEPDLFRDADFDTQFDEGR